MLFSCKFLSAQEKRYFTLDLGLSQTYRGFFYLYNGIVEFGATYNHQIIKSLYGGASFHMDYLSRSNTTARTIVYKPAINLNYNFIINHWFSINPLVAAGYSFVNISNDEFGYADTQKGFDLGAELRFIWYSQASVDYYFFGRYDFIYLKEDVNFTQLEYYRRVNLTSFGLGIKIKPKKESKYKDLKIIGQ